MAEGFVNHDLADDWEAYSAGTAPAGYVHPMAVQVMAELGIDVSLQRSKPVDELRGYAFDVVVTVCDDAAQDCPFWPGIGRKVHIAFEDPARAAGSDEERLAVFRRVRDELRRDLFDLLADGKLD